MVAKVGGWPVVRGAAYGLGLLVSFVLAGFGLVTVDQANELAEQLDRVLLIAGALVGGGVSATALKNLEKAPDVAGRPDPGLRVDELAGKLDELAPAVAGAVGGKVLETVRDSLGRIESSNLEAVASALSRLEAVLEQVTSSRGVPADPAPAGVVQPSAPVDPVLAARLELERRVSGT